MLNTLRWVGAAANTNGLADPNASFDPGQAREVLVMWVVDPQRHFFPSGLAGKARNGKLSAGSSSEETGARSE